MNQPYLSRGLNLNRRSNSLNSATGQGLHNQIAKIMSELYVPFFLKKISLEQRLFFPFQTLRKLKIYSNSDFLILISLQAGVDI